MDVISSERRRRRPSAAVVVAVALGLVAAGQAVAVSRTPDLPAGTALEVTLDNYALQVEAGEGVAHFQLVNRGGRAVRVTRIGADLPGLRLVDVTVTGEPLGFRQQGGPADRLPGFSLDPDVVVVVDLTYERAQCSQAVLDRRPVPVSLRSGRAAGTVLVGLPPLPDDALGASPDDLVEWQLVLLRALCGSS